MLLGSGWLYATSSALPARIVVLVLVLMLMLGGVGVFRLWAGLDR